MTTDPTKPHLPTVFGVALLTVICIVIGLVGAPRAATEQEGTLADPNMPWTLSEG